MEDNSTKNNEVNAVSQGEEPVSRGIVAEDGTLNESMVNRGNDTEMNFDDKVQQTTTTEGEVAPVPAVAIEQQQDIVPDSTMDGIEDNNSREENIDTLSSENPEHVTVHFSPLTPMPIPQAQSQAQVQVQEPQIQQQEVQDNNIAQIEDVHAVSIDTTAHLQHTNNNTASTAVTTSNHLQSKWSRNGFGEACPVAPKGGKFTAEETQIVRQAIEVYCTAKNVPITKLCSECDHKSELKGAWMEIAQKLPHRTVQSVYRHGIRQCHPFKRGPWTDEECAQLKELVKIHTKKWSMIQGKLNRSADSCRDKFREMSQDFVKGRWKESECSLLIRLVKEEIKPPNPNAEFAEIIDMIEKNNISIPWSLISKRMEKRSRLSCFKKWQKMVQTEKQNPMQQHMQIISTVQVPVEVQVQVQVTQEQQQQQNHFDEQVAALAMKKIPENNTETAGDTHHASSAVVAANVVEAVDLPIINSNTVNPGADTTTPLVNDNTEHTTEPNPISSPVPVLEQVQANPVHENAEKSDQKITIV